MMLKTIAPLALIYILTTSYSLAAETLELVSDESKIGFVGKKSDGKHEGGFEKFTSKAVADFEKPEQGKLEIEIDATSLWSDDEKLTNHLKSPDFFNVRTHAKISFKSTGISVGNEEGTGTIKGELTLLGKTIEIDVPCKAIVTDEAIELDANFVIDRTKWGMVYGEGKIDNEVDINAHLVFNR
jgi:polyisoprenoid-binding protein YceI